MLTAERVDDVGMLEGLPPFSTCTREGLEAFVANDAMRAHCAAGEVLCGLPQDENLYVLVSGSAVLRVSPGLSIKLESGDYFGQQSNPYHRVAGTVVAVTDVEVLVIGPQDLGRLALATSA
jgi:CRP-like cAMP-binding protein